MTRGSVEGYAASLDETVLEMPLAKRASLQVHNFAIFSGIARTTVIIAPQ